MGPSHEENYYITRKTELLAGFDKEANAWQPVIVASYGEDFAHTIIPAARRKFEALLPQIPYIGGDANHLTGSLIGAVRYLAFYQAMKARGKTAAETGKILYDAALAADYYLPPPIPPSERLSPADLMQRRRERAVRSQERQYPGGYVYEFVESDGEAFDFGYDFLECAAHKFYHAQNADEFMPFYCFLDFPKSRVSGMGLERTMTLADGYPRCNHRFRQGRQTEQVWPPPFLAE